jgi:predicted DCC family thiol-disulfide oxidoreductase YuxK
MMEIFSSGGLSQIPSFQTIIPFRCLPEMNGTVLFDSSCKLCTGLIRFIKRRDNNNRFLLVSLQSEEGKGVLQEAGLSETDSNTAVYIRDGRTFLRSSAVLNILKDLGGYWKLLFAFIIIPSIIRDFIYRLIASNRYIIFGRRDSCQI